jgi:anti-sigma factor RsiW
MSCADYSESIADFVDGSLDPARQRALERHVEGCAACRALVADLKSIQAAAFTLDRVELPPHLWPAV